MSTNELTIGSKVRFKANWRVPETTGTLIGSDGDAGQFYTVKGDDGKERRLRKGIVKPVN